MKNALRLLLAALLIFTVFASVASCGDSGSPETEQATEAAATSPETKSRIETLPAQTEPETQPASEPEQTVEKGDPGKYFAYKEFELVTGDLRQEALDWMYKQSQVTWKCKKTFSLKDDVSSQGYSIDFTYQGGMTYTGLPYANTYTMIPEFERFLTGNRTFAPYKDSWVCIPGVQCNTSIMASIQRFSSVTGTSLSLSPIDKEFQQLKVGEYETEGYSDTNAVCNGNGIKKMVEAYALMDKGDIIYRGPMQPHLRMVVENHPNRKSDGSIVTGRSYVVMIEQTSSIDKEAPKGVNTTWWVDHKYTYEDLFTKGFIPVTVREYENPNTVPFFLGLTNEITAQDLADQFLPGSVETNSVMRYVYLEILDSTGKVVSSAVRHNVQDSDLPTIGSSSRKVDLRAMGNALFKDLPDGNYTFVLTAGIPVGEAELIRVDFTFKK